MITVVVPIYNEKDNIEPLVKKIFYVAEELPVSEIIYVDDSSTDGSYDVLCELKSHYPALRIIKHKKKFGQSAALWTGVNAAVNKIIVTLDGDGQNPPEDIKILLKAYNTHKKNLPRLMVAGERIKRNDTLLRRISSRAANGIRSGLLKDKTKDTGCSMKLFFRSDYLKLPYFDHMHRFLPALMLREGVDLIHVGVSHKPRVYGESKYKTFQRAVVGISDLIGVLWLKKRSRRALEKDITEVSI
ncbi:MAG: glycosyltransferase family 2 protein [Thermodesulfobacteriota bacterium]|nr:glycosyltransferase family 2 protein [Thermodesulfobacteriota bacterium]